MSPRSAAIAAAIAGAVSSFAGNASAFTHIVKPGETLAQIAVRVYGDAKKETIIAGANALDSQGGSAPVSGMHLEIPAPGHHRVVTGESWSDLALQYLGDAKRADVLARMNQAVAWIAPIEGQEIQIPFVLTVICGEGERMDQLSLRYMGDANRSWELEAYNGRKGTLTAGPTPLKRGDVVLVPLLDVNLTDAGKAEARAGVERVQSQAAGGVLEVQRRAESELPLLLADVRRGRYVEAVARGNRVLGGGELTRVQLGVLHRALLEAYVALDAQGSAQGACAAWRAADPGARLDPATVSPKIRAACPK